MATDVAVFRGEGVIVPVPALDPCVPSISDVVVASSAGMRASSAGFFGPFDFNLIDLGKPVKVLWGLVNRIVSREI